MSRQTLLLTPNYRLSAHLKRSYAETRVAGAWLTPHVQPLPAWLESLWCELEARGTVTERLLKPTEEELVWEQVISESPESGVLLRLSATAKEAMKAFRLAEEWGVEVSQQAFSWTPDTEAFYSWRKAFLKKTTEIGLTTNAQLLKKLQTYNVATKLKLPSKISLYGFIDKPPTFASFLNYLANCGIKVETKKEVYPEKQIIQYYESAGCEEELATAVQWARIQLDTCPDSKIALVINNLEDVRDKVERALIDEFEPNVLLGMGSPKREVFNISAGIALSQCPIIDAALQLLMLQQPIIPTNKISSILRSPFFAWGDDQRSGAYQLDFELRESGNRHWPLKQLIYFIRNKDVESALQKRLINFFEQIKQQQTKRSMQRAPSYWVRAWAELLTLIGWPGERTISSEEFQAREAWQSLMVRFSQLDKIAGAINQEDAFKQLLKQTGSEVFQPQTPYAPIQVLGPLEAASIEFDALWFLGLDDIQWPAAPKPTPFIPLALQKAEGVPQSSPERECNYAKTLLSRILGLSPLVIISWANLQEDKNIAASPLIQPLLNSRYCPPTEPSFNLSSHFQVQHKLEVFKDAFGSPVVAEAHEGGTALLKAQASCPFQAYARYRLNASSIPSLSTGVTPMERGSILHAVLETFWNEVKTQKSLLMMSVEARRKMLLSMIKPAIEKELRDRVFSNGEVWLQVECDTCAEILIEWLSIESERPDFEVVATENADQVQVGPLNLKVRLDRIDRLKKTGDLLLIDYKTGVPKLNDWFGDRPLEPQLPLYAVSRDDVKSLAFGHIKKGSTQLVGLSKDDQAAVGITDIQEYTSGLMTWDDTIIEWKLALEGLSQDFCSGNAEVDPKHSGVCDYCELSTLCRVSEKGAIDDKHA